MSNALPQLRSFALSLFTCLFLSALLSAQSGSLSGQVTDSLGAAVPAAKVELIRGNEVIDRTSSDDAGNFTLRVETSGRYSVRASAEGFRVATSDTQYLGSGQQSRQDVRLSVGAVQEEITVTATGTPLPQAQLGSAVTLLDSGTFTARIDVQQPLRLVPGAQLNQSGRAGSLTSLFIRGGDSDANKVLLDGVPADDIGGIVDFGRFETTGLSQMEILRGPNSTLYGADALAGVISLTTQRGSTPLPQFIYSGDGGNFGTYHQEASLAGAFRQFDYFSSFSRFDTSNGIPGSEFHDGTYAGNFGWSSRAGTSLRATVRHIASAAGNPNQIGIFGIADSAVQRNHDLFVSGVLENQTTLRWHNLIRYGALRLKGDFEDFVYTGIPDVTPFGTNYLGLPVRLKGANGYETDTAQGILQFADSYPSSYVTPTKRDFVYGQSDYQVTHHLQGLIGFKYEHERGYTLFDQTSRSNADRTNYTYSFEARGDVHNRLYYALSGGVENNQLFGVEATPRASLAYYLFRPTPTAILSGTKLRGSFSKGIKDPSISQQNSSLYSLLAALPNGTQLIQQYRVAPIAAPTSRSYDAGVDQSFLNSRGKIGVTYFHNEFEKGVQGVPQLALPLLGVPAEIVAQAPFGAVVNAQAVRAQGIESEIEYRVNNHLYLRGGYTYLDAVVQKSFSSDAFFGGSINPKFPDIPLGSFAPLKGARPFRRAPHTGYFGIYYDRSRWSAAFTGALVGRRDDSTLVFDKDFLNLLLLPNRNLDDAYQKLDLNGNYRLSRIFSLYAAGENLLSQHYSESFGYPALPFCFRAGVRITLGGESWKLQ